MRQPGRQIISQGSCRPRDRPGQQRVALHPVPPQRLVDAIQEQGRDQHLAQCSLLEGFVLGPQRVIQLPALFESSQVPTTVSRCRSEKSRRISLAPQYRGINNQLSVPRAHENPPPKFRQGVRVPEKWGQLIVSVKNAGFVSEKFRIPM